MEFETVIPTTGMYSLKTTSVSVIRNVDVCADIEIEPRIPIVPSSGGRPRLNEKNC